MIKGGENKDAYDLYFVIRNYGNGVDDVCKCLGPLLKEAETQKAIEILNRDFSEPDDVGPNRVARFLYAGPDADLQADVVGFVRELLSKSDMMRKGATHKGHANSNIVTFSTTT